MRYRAALIGNPNCGKTTLFNALTGENAHVGNWPGGTVEKREAAFALDGDEILFTDLPGAYSLAPDSVEEKIAAEYLEREGADVVVNVADANCLARGLFLTTQLLSRGRNVVLAVNMWDEFSARGGRLDLEALSARLGVRATAISARKKQGFDGLFACIRDSLGATPKGRAEFADLQPEQRYEKIGEILRRSDYAQGKERGYGADRWLLRGCSGVACFFVMLAALFLMTFGPVGQAFSAGMQEMLEIFVQKPVENVLRLCDSPEWVRSLALEGVVGGVGAVTAFLPQMLLLLAGLCAWEESGYMARAAYLADGPMRAIGLSGRAFVPLLMGFGCTASAAVGARAVEREDERRRTALLCALMSCGAKAPVYAYVTQKFWPEAGFGFVLLLYMLGPLMLWPFGKILRLGEGQAAFAMEIPPLRAPSARGIAKRLRQRAAEFLKRAGTLLFLVSVGMWFLREIHWLEKIAGLIAPLFAPMGLGSWQVSAAFLSGMAAKEAMISALETSGAVLSQAQAAAFCAFTALMPACIPAQIILRRECGSAKLALRMALLQTGAAWIAGLGAYWLCF